MSLPQKPFKGQLNYPEDSRYPPFDYLPKTEDDLIDFPCSGIWRDYYYQRGMTPYPNREVPRDNKATSELINLANELKEFIQLYHKRKVTFVPKKEIKIPLSEKPKQRKKRERGI